MPTMSATERAREAVARAICTGLRHGDPDEPVTDSGHVLWELHVEAADMALSALASLPLPDRLALLLSESERADRKKLDEAFRATLLLARLKWGNLDPDANGIFALADEALAASDAAHAG